MTRNGLHFRMAEPADASALGEFMARNVLLAYGHCSTPENVQAAVQEHYGEPAQLRQILDGNRCNLIALDGERWVGHAQLHLGNVAPTEAPGLPALEVSRFYIDTEFHGRGAAQALMAEVKREARARGAASLWLSVWQEAPQAIRFYQKSQFRIAGELVFMVGTDPKDDWLMVCDLAPSD
jgi:GNAT superfamily N-acetyltransferase